MPIMTGKGRVFRVWEVDGFEVLVGKSARENDELTFRIGRPHDTWLHVAGFSGSHVIVRDPRGTGDEPPRAVLERAAELAAWNSKAREAGGKVEVHVCRVADVSKPRGSAPGKVQLRRFDRLKVYPRE